MRPIDADVLQRRICGAKCGCKHEECGCDEGECVFDRFISNAPTVDAVPVIRCRDCKHHRIFLKRDMCARHAQILNGHEVGVCATREDDFCSYGERKEGGEDAE